ncbi:MAG: bifunctional diguanylate cyclase/phosphodiesterase [Actinomycetota bacterium]
MAGPTHAEERDDAPTEGSQIFAVRRSLLGGVVLLADALVAIGAAIGLRGEASVALLAAWAVLVVATSYGWEFIQRLYPNRQTQSDRIQDRLGWVATIVWAGLPWIVFDSIEAGATAWLLVFVVVYGVATDLFYQSPTELPEFDVQLLIYPGSFVVAFALNTQWLPVGAVVVAGVSLVVAARVWLEVNDVLIERREKIEEDARTDPLTGLATRAAAIEAVEQLVAEGHPTVFCAFIDIDDFKYLNDNHGYALGDAVLRAVGRDLVQKLPDTWTVARFGGDEYVAVGPTRADFSRVIESQLNIDGREAFQIAQSLTVGLTALPSVDLEAGALFREAGAALRHAKQLGKHQVIEVTPHLRAADASRNELGSQAGAALDAGEITPWAQLIIDLDTGRPAGLELLARWQRADGTMISPAEFIPVIEEQGRGPALGMQMITHAIDALSAPAVRREGLFVSVNVSARHLYHRRLPDEITDLLVLRGVDANRLILEITESEHLPSSPIWRETADRLRVAGIGLAMDDLGTGYSTVEKLLDVPFSHVKIDRVLTQALHRPGTAQLAAAFATMAAGASMSAVVEGIETDEQVGAMRAAGYHLGQGFLFHRPEPLQTAVDHALMMEPLALAEPAEIALRQPPT